MAAGRATALGGGPRGAGRPRRVACRLLLRSLAAREAGGLHGHPASRFEHGPQARRPRRFAVRSLFGRRGGRLSPVDGLQSRCIPRVHPGKEAHRDRSSRTGQPTPGSHGPHADRPLGPLALDYWHAFHDARRRGHRRRRAGVQRRAWPGLAANGSFPRGTKWSTKSMAASRSWRGYFANMSWRVRSAQIRSSSWKPRPSLLHHRGRDPPRRRLAVLKGRDVRQGFVGDSLQRPLGKKGLVPGDDHVGKSQHP